MKKLKRITTNTGIIIPKKHYEYIELKDDLDDISNLLDNVNNNLKSKMIEELEKE